MSTEAKIHANRLNAQKSTGPQTPQGKAVVSQNALKHGLSARHDVITTESQADFDLHRDALLAELDPIGPMESILADRIVSLSWRLKRADLIQNQTFDAMHEKNTNNSLANIAKSFGLKGLGLPQLDPADSNPDLILGRIAIKDFSNARVLDRLLMYERRIEHSLQNYPRTPKTPPPPKPRTPQRRQTRTRSPPSIPRPCAGGQHRTKHHRRGGENRVSRIQNRESRIQNPASRIEYRASRIQHHCAKQTQFPQRQNQRNFLCHTDLQQYSAPPRPQKTNPIKPNPPAPGRDTQYDIRHPTCKTTSPKRKRRGIHETTSPKRKPAP
jgi:hypothetical protein